MMLQPNIVSKCLYGMMRCFHPLEGTDVCCDEGLLTTRKRLQSGNWQQAGSTPPSMSTNVPRCCSSRSIGYSFACQEKVMHKQRCHIHIGLPTESFHHGVVRLTTSAGGTWQYHHNMFLKWLEFTSLSYQEIFPVFLCCGEGHLGRLCKADKKKKFHRCCAYYTRMHSDPPLEGRVDKHRFPLWRFGVPILPSISLI